MEASERTVGLLSSPLVVRHCCIEARGVLATAQASRADSTSPLKIRINRVSKACCVASGRVGVAISGRPIAQCNCALRSAPGTIGTLLGQLDRLVAVADLPTVELGIVPFPAMPIMPLSNFYIHDDVVYIETLTGEQQLVEPNEVAVYVKAFDLLRPGALTGAEAVTFIQRVAAELRESSS